ncbi:hypothetical protein J6590_012917 [Homalodisca vitripennis]|nr:hypothetical protein J6590_012917 [Homalodisca vitripennis]
MEGNGRKCRLVKITSKTIDNRDRDNAIKREMICLLQHARNATSEHNSLLEKKSVSGEMGFRALTMRGLRECVSLPRTRPHDYHVSLSAHSHHSNVCANLAINELPLCHYLLRTTLSTRVLIGAGHPPPSPHPPHTTIVDNDALFV